MSNDLYTEIERNAKNTIEQGLRDLNNTLASGQSHVVIAKAVAKAIAEAIMAYDNQRRA